MTGSRHRRTTHRAAAASVLALALTACNSPDPNVATQHNDNLRTGAYLAETTLTPAAVGARGMRVKYWLKPCVGNARDPHVGAPVAGCIDGAIVTQPLYVNSVDFNRETPVGRVSGRVPGVFVATTANVVYGIDADNGLPIWATPLSPGRLSKWVSSTPVIDVGSRRLYVVYAIKNQVEDLPLCEDRNSDNPQIRRTARQKADSLVVEYHLAMLDITNGDVLADRLITGQYRRRSGETLSFVAKHHVNHPALLLQGGSIYVAFGSPAWSEGCVEYHGWVMRYNAADLRRLGVFNTSPERTEVGSGAGVWQGGGGLAGDGSAVYFLTGDGPADRSLEIVGSGRDMFSRSRRFYGDSIVRLQPSGSSFTVAAYSPPDAKDLQAHDADLGSGGALLVPASDVVIGGGKSGRMYVLNRASMQTPQIFDGTTNVYNPALRGDTWDKGPHLHGSPTYWTSPNDAEGWLYVWGEKDILRQYRFDKQKRLVEPTAPVRSGTIKALWNVMPGGMLSLSADRVRRGTGVLWGTLPLNDRTPYQGGLYAFDAETLGFLWSARYGTIAHWVPPTIAGGKVFVAEGDPFKAGSEKLTVYELGRPDGSDRSRGGPVQPQGTPTCKYCHSRDLAKVTAGIAMSDHHATGGSVRMKPGLALDAISPGGEYRVAQTFTAMGVRTFEAAVDANTTGRLVWTEIDAWADLLDANDEAPASLVDALNADTGTAVRTAKPVDDRRQTHFLTRGLLRASDGSVAQVEPERSVAAPEHPDADWALLRVTRNEGNGVLGRAEYVQQVYTHAGRPPATAPTTKGTRVNVPFAAEYWVYR